MLRGSVPGSVPGSAAASPGAEVTRGAAAARRAPGLVWQLLLPALRRRLPGDLGKQKIGPGVWRSGLGVRRPNGGRCCLKVLQ